MILPTEIVSLTSASPARAFSRVKRRRSARKIVSTVSKPRPAKSVENLETASRIVATICERFNVTPAQLESPSRAWAITYPRWLAISLIRAHTSFSLQAIAVLFNRNDHSTMLHAISGLHDEISTNPKAKADWDSFSEFFSRRSQ